MSLKQSVVIVSEFTIKSPGGGGSRGGTPGAYVLRYMARNGATEDLTPVQFDMEPYITRYMARSEAVDSALSVGDLKESMKNIQGDGGIAFGYGDFSLSHRKLKAAAKDIQDNFEKGKTVIKTVLSFDESYLRQNGIIDEGFIAEKEGDYRGNIDQLKLRMAIMNGIDRMARDYDDLQYIGVIQVDTMHVHCHLAMVDRGKGIIMPDGTQKGKISEHSKKELRRGIDMFLDEKQTVKMLSANVEYDRRNTICFVKKYTHRAMDNRGFTQFLLACLPNDKNLWRADTNNRAMQKPNRIMREYVQELLALPDSGYREALQKVDTYARNRTKREGLSGKEYRTLYRNGQEQIISGCMNTAYSVLKQISNEDMEVRTPMMEVMALPYETMASEAESDPMIEFGFKLRSYHSRLGHHRSERHKYHQAVLEYERQDASGEVDAASRPLYDYFRVEEEYNAMLMAKYQYFLKFIPPESEYMEGLEDILEYERRLDATKRMSKDTEMPKMYSGNAEEYGLRVYGESGGRYTVVQPSALEARVQRMESDLSSMRREYRLKLADYGMQQDENGVPRPALEYEFQDVKALDLHHLLYDFPYDFPISAENVDKFLEMADKRYDSYQKARVYLEGSGQVATLGSLPGMDIEVQHTAAERFRTDATMYTKREASEEKRAATRTIRMDHHFYDEREAEIKDLIKSTINSLQYEDI